MIDLEGWQRGTEIPIAVQCEDDDGNPSNPDQAPILALFTGSTLITRVKMPADSKAHQPGVFRLPIFLDASFPASGPIHGSVQYLSGGLTFSVPVFFRILAGGDPDGAVISATFVRRPGLGAIVYQLDSGTVCRGSNPRSQR